MKTLPLRDCAVLFILTSAVFLPCLFNGFVLDDAAYIVYNQVLGHPTRWPGFFIDAYSLSGDPGLSKIIYRPLVGISHALNYMIAGPSPFWFHLHDIILHALNVCLVFLLARRLDEKSPRAWAAALLFSLHPAQAQSVAYVGSRGGLLSIFFIILSLLFYDASRDSGRKRFAGYSWATFLMALLSKESSVFFLLILPAWDYFRKSSENSWQARFLRWGPYLFMTLAFVGARTAVLGHVSQRGPWGNSWSLHYQLAAHALFEYLRIALWPTHLREPYGFIITPHFQLESIAMFIVSCALFAASLFGLRHRDVSGFAGYWFFAALAPISNVIPFATLTADRLLYASIVGLALLVSFYLPKKSLTFFWGVTISLAMTLAVLNLEQQFHWRSDFVLASEAVAEAPKEPYAGLRLSTYYAHWRMFSRAESLLEPSQESSAPPDVRRTGLRRLGQIKIAQGRPGEAITFLEASLRMEPLQKTAIQLLGQCYLAVGDRARAEENFKKAAALP